VKRGPVSRGTPGPHLHAGGRFRTVLAVLLDALAIALALAAVIIILVGGWEGTIAGQSVRARSAGNPILGVLIVAAIRALTTSTPFLNRRRLSMAVVTRTASDWLGRLDRQLDSLGPAGARRAVWMMIGVASAIRLANIVVHFGFITGDDVEVHAMTLGVALGREWPIWDLRNAFFPMVFLYPAQRLLVACGLSDVFWLVAAGRLVIACIAGANIWLVYRVGLNLFDAPRTALIAAVLFASNHLQMAFGSAELPRIVAAGFFVAAFGLALQPTLGRSAAAGVLIGVGASLRFGEVVFLVPALWTMWTTGAPDRFRGRLVRTGVLLGASTMTLLAVIGISDALYWGQPFHSLMAITDYTLVDRLSSRGFQPAWFYITEVSSWSNVLLVVLAVLWRAQAPCPALAWAALPVVLLSLLPHKEPRYLIATIPFWALAAAPALSSLLAQRRDGHFWLTRARLGAAATVLVVACAFAFDASKFRFVRSEDAVRLGWMMRSLGAKGLVAEQLWRFGGPLYLDGLQPLIEVDLPAPGALTRVRSAVCSSTADWAAFRRQHVNDELRRIVAECGMETVPHLPDGGYSLYRRRAAGER
jgi:hypothetical protein